MVKLCETLETVVKLCETVVKPWLSPSKKKLRMTNQRLLESDNPGNRALSLQFLGEQAPSSLHVPVALVLQFGKGRARPSFDDETG